MRQKDSLCRGNRLSKLPQILCEGGIAVTPFIMQITLSLIGDVPVFHLSGRLDVTTSPSLEERIKPLEENIGQKMIFNCQELTYVSSAGLRVFLSAQRQCAASNGGVAFAALSQPVGELFSLAGLDGLFIIESTIEGAAERLVNPENIS
jgi:anti-sigma B factor antagonist